MNIEQLKSSRDILIAEIEKANGRMARGNQCHCPFHEDTNASAGINEVNGHWVFCCQVCSKSGVFKGGTAIDIRAKDQGITVKEAMKQLGVEMSTPNRTSPLPPLPGQTAPAPTLSKSYPPLPAKYLNGTNGNGHHANGTGEHDHRVYPTVEALIEKHVSDGTYVAHWEYTNPETNTPDLIVMRWLKDGKKSYKQASPVPGGFSFHGAKGKLPLYARDRVAAASTILIVEGEKCADIANTLLPHEYAATTSAGGAGKAALTDWSPLAGKRVTLWPDKDDKGTGQKHMDDIAAILNGMPNPPIVSCIDVAMLPIGNKGDIEQWADFYPEGHNLTPQLIAEIENADSCGASRSFQIRLKKIQGGELETVDYPNSFGEMTRITNGTLPGTTTVWCGWPGSRKSFLTLSFYVQWHLMGHKVALLELEEDRAFWLQRVLALVSKNSNMMDLKWMKRCGTESSRIFNQNKHILDSFGARITDCDKEMTQEACVDWVRDRAQSGCRFILVDPVSMLVIDGPDQARADLSFVTKIKNIAKEYNCTIDLVTHPPKSAAQTKGRTLSLADVSGGSAYTRYSQTVFWVEGCSKREFRVEKKGALLCNSMVTVAKARNGTGAFRVIGAHFDPATLEFAEQGIIEEKEK